MVRQLVEAGSPCSQSVPVGAARTHGTPLDRRGLDWARPGSARAHSLRVRLGGRLGRGGRRLQQRLALLQRLYAKSRDRLPNDARVFQIVFLSALLTTGVLLRDFSVQPLQIALAFAAGLATQAFWLKRLGLQQKGLLSAIVTCCGLSLLLRSDTLWAHPVAAALAMATPSTAKSGLNSSVTLLKPKMTKVSSASW